MNVLRFPVLALLFALVFTAAPALAGESDPLFINLTSDDSHKAKMAIGFGAAQNERGHALTIFFNDKAVQICSKANAEKFPEQQAIIAKLAKAKANLLICPTCMKHFGIKQEDLLPGITVGNPDLTGGLLFRDGTKTLSW